MINNHKINSILGGKQIMKKRISNSKDTANKLRGFEIICAAITFILISGVFTACNNSSKSEILPQSEYTADNSKQTGVSESTTPYEDDAKTREVQNETQSDILGANERNDEEEIKFQIFSVKLNNIIDYQILKFDKNMPPERMFENGFKTAPVDKDFSVTLKDDVVINSIIVNDDLVEVDFNSAFENHGYGHGIESIMLEAVVNTLGNYYGVKEVKLTVAGKSYDSGHGNIYTDDIFPVEGFSSIEDVIIYDYPPSVKIPSMKTIDSSIEETAFLPSTDAPNPSGWEETCYVYPFEDNGQEKAKKNKQNYIALLIEEGFISDDNGFYVKDNVGVTCGLVFTSAPGGELTVFIFENFDKYKINDEFSQRSFGE